MEVENERRLPLARDTVWEALNDPEVLQACVPGCESFDKVDDNAYDAVVMAKVGPVRARFKGRLTLTDLEAPQSYTLSFHGQGGQAGFVKGTAAVRLDEEEGGCRVGYSVKATLGGKLAQLGSRLVDSAAQKTANDFFANFVRHMGGEEAAAGGAAPAAVPGGASSRRWAWIAAGVALLVVVIIIASL